MILLRKILYWLIGIAAVVALAGLIAVWGVLGVNPFEGKQDQLWQLTSYDVNFFVRFPGSRLLKDRFVRNLEQEAEIGVLGDLRESIETLTAQIARETGGQLPFGQTVDFERDFVGKEMAIAGKIAGDYHQMRVDNFVVLTRIAGYAKFISALKRGFVRDRIPDADRIQLVKGLYFRIRVDAETQKTLDSFRSVRGGMGPRDELYLARIRDVVIISDNAQWIEDAIAGGTKVLPADAWFESEFIRTSRGGDSVEAFFRMELTGHALQAHSREEGTLTYALEKLVPIPMAGDVTVRLDTRGSSQLRFELSDLPDKKSFPDIKQYLRRIYNTEKADIRAELGIEGIGRFVPKENVVGAMVLRVNPEQLVDVLLSLMPRAYADVFDEEVRKTSKGRWPSLERLLRHLSEDLSDTHLVVFHRPTVFQNAPWDVYEDPWDEVVETPKGQMAISIVSRMKDTVAPTAVEQKLMQNLTNLGLLSKGINKEFGFRKASPTIREEDLQLFDPAFGALAGRYFFLSTMWETAEALGRAARGDEGTRLLADERIASMVASLPRSGTMGMILNGPVLYPALYDGVREWATERMGIAEERGRIAEGHRRRKKSEDEIADLVDREIAHYKERQYDKLREDYARLLQPLKAIDGIGLVVSLGVGSENKITAEGVLLLEEGEPEEP